MLLVELLGVLYRSQRVDAMLCSQRPTSKATIKTKEGEGVAEGGQDSCHAIPTSNMRPVV